MELAIQARKRFGDFSLECDLTLHGERIGVFGPSGGGKSTFVRLIAGLDRPDIGEIVLDGEVLFSSARRIHLPPQERRIALVFQHAALFQHLSVRDNILFGFRRRRAPATLDQGRLHAVLGLEQLLDRGVEKLSGGEKQRVALARAILSAPRLLLMDEPLSALDDALRYQIIPYLHEVSSTFGIPFLFVSHSLNEMRLLTDEVVVLHQGRCSGQMSPEELARQRMGRARGGYINLLRLGAPEQCGDLFAYRFGTTQLLMWLDGGSSSIFELSSKDIMLFKGRPEAVSARNLLPCRVVQLLELENRVGVELDCGGEGLIATVVRQAAEELDLHPGDNIHALIKASAFRKLI